MRGLLLVTAFVGVTLWGGCGTQDFDVRSLVARSSPLALGDIIGKQPTVSCAEGAICDGKADPYTDCENDTAVDEVKCEFDYNIFKGAQAYANAFSFVNPPTADAKERELKQAAGYFAYAIAYALLSLRNDSTAMEVHYLSLVDPSTERSTCSYLSELASFGADTPRLMQQMHDYYYARVLRALQSYEEVIDALVRFYMAHGDAAATEYPEYATQRQKEFEYRSLALQVLMGSGAVLPSCTIDPELAPIALALGRIGESNGNLDQAKRDDDGSINDGLAPWVDLAARQLQEQSIADGMIPRTIALADDGSRVLSPMGASPGTLPWQYYRGLSNHRPSRWMCNTMGTTVETVDLPSVAETAYTYATGAAQPQFGGADAAAATLEAVAAAAGAASMHRHCVPIGDPTGTDGPNELVGAVQYLEALAAEVFSWSAEPPVIVNYDHTAAAATCDAIDATSLRGSYDSPVRAAIAEEIETTIGKPIGRWRVDVAVRTLEYQDLTCETDGADTTVCPTNYLLVGREALEALAGAKQCEGGARPCRELDLEGMWYSETVWKGLAQPFESKDVPGGGFDTTGTMAAWSMLRYPQRFTDHPVRAACSGSPACDDYPWYSSGFADDIFLLREKARLGVDATGGPLTIDRPITLYLYREGDTCPAGQKCFPLGAEGGNEVWGWIVDWLTPADVSYNAADLVTRFDGGLYRQILGNIMAREPSRCVATRYNSLGLEKRLVPALENELIEDGMPTESSFAYYLDRAASAAANAAAAVDAAYDSEVQLKRSLDTFATESQLLSEEAGEAIAKICGAGFSGTECTAERTSVTLGEIGEGTLLPVPSTLLSRGNTLSEATCGPILGSPLPKLDDLEDESQFNSSLSALADLAYCTAFRVVTDLRAARLDGLPDVLADGDFSYDEQVLFGGEYLQAMLSMENQLLDLGGAAISVATTCQALAQQLEGAKAHVSSIMTSTEGKIGSQLVVAGQALQSIAQAWSSPDSIFGAGVAATAGALMSAGGRELELMDQYRKEEASANAVVREFASGVLQSVGELRMKAKSMEAAITQLVSLRTSLDALELDQEQAYNRADRALERVKDELGLSGAYIWLNATKTNREARREVLTSQRLSFVARRAIEFRLITDLDLETVGNGVTDAPSRWGNDILFIENAVAADAAGGQSSSNAYKAATVDYTDKLRNFVGYYGLQYPFQSSLDTAVLSLKDDFEKVRFSCDDYAQALDYYGQPASTLPCMCFGPDGELVPAVAGSCVDGDRLPPYDFDGVLLREKFRVKCVNGGLEPYGTAACGGHDIEYYQIELAVPLLALEGGTLSDQGQIAADRYNYRWDSVAVNLVGSNVKDCTLDVASQATCYQSAFVPYTFEHAGDVSLRDHGGQLRRFVMSTARVQHGKALAAERVLTAPLAQSDASLIDQYVSPELRGRPLQGNYILRIYNVPSLVFEQLQDVQLLVRYRSWTPFDPVQ